MVGSNHNLQQSFYFYALFEFSIKQNLRNHWINSLDMLGLQIHDTRRSNLHKQDWRSQVTGVSSSTDWFCIWPSRSTRLQSSPSPLRQDLQFEGQSLHMSYFSEIAEIHSCGQMQYLDITKASMESCFRIHTFVYIFYIVLYWCTVYINDSKCTYDVRLFKYWWSFCSTASFEQGETGATLLESIRVAHLQDLVFRSGAISALNLNNTMTGCVQLACYGSLCHTQNRMERHGKLCINLSKQVKRMASNYENNLFLKFLGLNGILFVQTVQCHVDVVTSWDFVRVLP